MLPACSGRPVHAHTPSIVDTDIWLSARCRHDQLVETMLHMESGLSKTCRDDLICTCVPLRPLFRLVRFWLLLLYQFISRVLYMGKFACQCT